MDLFILRHGDAESFASSDQNRALTAFGRRQVHELCSTSISSISNVQQIIVSPYLRALQTAEIVSEYLDAPVEESELLTPESSVSAVIERLYRASEQFDCMMIVSHQPLVAELLEQLGGFEPGQYVLGTASLAWLSCNPPARDCCELNWLRP